MSWNDTVQKMRQTRDELELQAHLFKAEARDEWHRLEKSWEHFTALVDRDAKRSEDDEDDAINDMLTTAASELEHGFKSLLELLKDPLP